MFQWSLTLTHPQIQFLRACAVAEWDDRDPWWYHNNIGHLFTNDMPTERTLVRQGLLRREPKRRKNEHTGKYERTSIPMVTERGGLVLQLIELDARDLSKTDNARQLTAPLRKGIAEAAEERKTA